MRIDYRARGGGSGICEKDSRGTRQATATVARTEGDGAPSKGGDRDQGRTPAWRLAGSEPAAGRAEAERAGGSGLTVLPAVWDKNPIVATCAPGSDNQPGRFAFRASPLAEQVVERYAKRFCPRAGLVQRGGRLPRAISFSIDAEHPAAADSAFCANPRCSRQAVIALAPSTTMR